MARGVRGIKAGERRRFSGGKMRNALICAGTMLALLVLWPLVFGGGGASRASASTVTIAVPPSAMPSPTLAALPNVVGGTESCRVTLARARRACAPGDAACAQDVADAFDICEAKGRWPS